MISNVDIVLSDAYLGSMLNNQELLSKYGFMKSASDQLKGINRKGCSCNWSGKVKAVYEQMRNSLISLPIEEIQQVKTTLGVTNRKFLTYRKRNNTTERIVI